MSEYAGVEERYASRPHLCFCVGAVALGEEIEIVCRPSAKFRATDFVVETPDEFTIRGLDVDGKPQMHAELPAAVFGLFGSMMSLGSGVFFPVCLPGKEIKLRVRNEGKAAARFVAKLYGQFKDAS